jgi:hypothetical protein
MQGNDSYRLVVRRGPQPNQVHTLEEDVINVGRDITNTLVINDREVSRLHMRLMRGAEGYSIEDLGSTNGTFVNGKRVSGVTPLKNGDMVGMGETVTLGYEVVRAGQQPPTQQPAQSPAQPPAQPSPQPPADGAPSAPADNYDAYRPPAQQPAQQPAQPASYQQDAPDAGYEPQGYDQQDYDQQGGYYPPQNYAPPPPGYDYDPYAMREEGGSNTMRIFLFGCLGLMIFCCLITIVGVVLVDTLNLYCDLPIIRDVLEALGLLACTV